MMSDFLTSLGLGICFWFLVIIGFLMYLMWGEDKEE